MSERTPPRDSEVSRYILGLEREVARWETKRLDNPLDMDAAIAAKAELEGALIVRGLMEARWSQRDKGGVCLYPGCGHDPLHRRVVEPSA